MRKSDVYPFNSCNAMKWQLRGAGKWAWHKRGELVGWFEAVGIILIEVG